VVGTATVLNRLSAPGNDTYMLSGDAPHPACPECGFVVNHDWVDPGFGLTRKQYDASFTYDGYLIVSQAFRNAADDRDLKYTALPSAPGFYALQVVPVLRFDVERRETRFLGLCQQCGRYAQVVGATPVFLLDEPDEPTHDFYRTDHEFGSFDGKHPVILVTDQMSDRLSHLRGFDLVPI
jgi:hypothetical protein